MNNVILLFFLASTTSYAFFPDTFRASFIEERTEVLSKKKVRHIGSVEYKYPAQVKFEVEGPIKTILVIGPKKTWHYTAPFIEGEKGELKVTSTKKKSLGKIFDSVRKGLTSNQDYDVNKKKRYYEVLFKKMLKEETGVEKIHLTFKKETPQFQFLEAMEIFYRQKSKRYIFQRIRPNIPLSAQHFQFTPPRGTNVTFI